MSHLEELIDRCDHALFSNDQDERLSIVGDYVIGYQAITEKECGVMLKRPKTAIIPWNWSAQSYGSRRANGWNNSWLFAKAG